MVVIKDPQNYRLLRFEKSNSKNKKYDAILKNKQTQKEKRVPFGDKRYQHYKDSTPNKLYKHLDHGDKKRRANYRSRHSATSTKKFSSSYFAYYYLW